MDVHDLYLLVPAAPLLGAIIVGLFGPKLGRAASHWLCILGVADRASWRRSSSGRDVRAGHSFNGDVYTWLQSGDFKVSIGFLIDPLTTTMMLVVTFVSLMVHVYTIGYMADDPGYTRFFSLHLALHVRDADAGHEQQLRPALLRLGGGGPGFVSPDRLLVHAADGDLRESQGVSRQPRRRLRLRAGDRPHPGPFRHARLRAGIRPGGEPSSARRSISGARTNGR